MFAVVVSIEIVCAREPRAITVKTTDHVRHLAKAQGVGKRCRDDIGSYLRTGQS